MTQIVDAKTDPTASAPTSALPLYVDLDHTLVRTDVAQEMLIRSAKSPVALWRALKATLQQGFSGLKSALAQEVPLRADLLPYNEAVLDHIAAARAAGRPVILATAADQHVAEAVAAHLGVFDEIIASSPGSNLKGAAKLVAIQAHCDNGPFEYLGDSQADMPIWQAATARGFAKAPKEAQHWLDEATLQPTATGSTARALLKAMRPHQWAKNALLFLPLIFAHLYIDSASLMAAALGFLAFSLCASAVYLLNDLLDVDSDRAHATKCNRPFAAGTLRPLTGLAASTGLFALALIFGALIGPLFLAILITYVTLTKAYSLWLKQYSTIDVVVLALLYTVRIIAGAAAIMVMPSPWLLTFSLFFFLSLAYMKRYIELSRLIAAMPQVDERLPARNYYSGDITVVQTFGIANGALSLLTLAEYVNSDTVKERYLTPEFLWLLLPVMMFWTYRSWMWANRDQIGDDPVVFALRDQISRISVAAMLAIVLLARYVDLGGFGG